MTPALWALALVVLAVAGLAVVVARRARTDAAVAREDARRATVAAAGAERRRREALRSLPVMALRVDSEGRILETSARASQRFPFLVAGMGVLEAFSEHRLAGRVEAALRDMEPQRFEVRLFVDGRRTYRASVEPYEVDEGREALLSLTDASEAVAYQELRSQFVANVSHELRTPLTGLRALLEALDDPAMDPGTRRDFVGRAASETQRLEALISDILFLSELESTQDLPSPAVSDLSRAVVATAEDLEPVARAHGVRLEVDVPDAAWTPLTERMADTVVRNLLENAAKYAGHGAIARARVRGQEEVVVLEVADDGAGIPERHLPHVFERFYRADPSRSKRLGGTGLGLSIVKHIAERFGGRATAASREGFGTTVTVTPPAAPASAEGAEAAADTRADGPSAGS